MNRKNILLLLVLIFALVVSGCSSSSASVGIIGGADGKEEVFVSPAESSTEKPETSVSEGQGEAMSSSALPEDFPADLVSAISTAENFDVTAGSYYFIYYDTKDKFETVKSFYTSAYQAETDYSIDVSGYSATISYTKGEKEVVIKVSGSEESQELPEGQQTLVGITITTSQK